MGNLISMLYSEEGYTKRSGCRRNVLLFLWTLLIWYFKFIKCTASMLLLGYLITIFYKTINKRSPIYFHNNFTPDYSSAHSTFTPRLFMFGIRRENKGDPFISLKRMTLYGLKTVQYFGSKL